MLMKQKEKKKNLPMG